MPVTRRFLIGLGVFYQVACGGCFGSSRAVEEGTDGPSTESGGETDGNIVERDGMVLIPAGSFWRGCNRNAGDLCEDEVSGAVLYNVPYRELELSDFWIDKFEVTVDEYDACGAAGVCTAPGGIPWADFVPPDEPNLPVTGVSWKQAETYCAWASKRLPTEAEWEKAARGVDGRLYPWGNDPPECGQAHVLLEDCRVRHVLPVDAHPGDRSPYGAFGMQGNVQEWVGDWAARSYYEIAPASDPPGPLQEQAYRDNYKVVRGNYWDSGPRWTLSPRHWGDWETGVPGRIGFRCARSEAPP